MSVSTEEYLEALYNLTQDGRTASTSEISKRLNVTPASVTDMLRKLADRGLINYLPYQGVTLTEEGFKEAAKMTRKHRLSERFLHDILKIGNDNVHKEACKMEHGLSDETERALCLKLKSPDKCPDDEKIIPACELAFPTCDECRKWNGDNVEEIGKRDVNVISITSLKANQQGKIAFIRGNDKVLQRLLDLGLTPGTKVCVTRVAPLRGPVELSIRGSQVALGDQIACNIFIERTGNEL